jgi:hypothetical protein
MEAGFTVDESIGSGNDENAQPPAIIQVHKQDYSISPLIATWDTAKITKIAKRLSAHCLQFQLYEDPSGASAEPVQETQECNLSETDVNVEETEYPSEHPPICHLHWWRFCRWCHQGHSPFAKKE